MSQNISPLAGHPAPLSMLVDVEALVRAYRDDVPDPSQPDQRVVFGTSGHRGSALTRSFNEWHVFAITQAICEYRARQGTNGPLFLGIDTHALSVPAWHSAIQVLAGNGVETMLAVDDEYTPTPAVSRAILRHNHARASGLADGIVVTPSHNPPEDGGFKYNPPHGGPASTEATGWIEARANELLETSLDGMKCTELDRALRAATTRRFDFLGAYVEELGSVIDMDVIRDAKLRLCVDPLGGAGVHYWPRIAERYGLDLSIVNREVDPTFRFMTLDWDGRIRMDPSSKYAMQGLIVLKDRFDIAFACDTDHDRHGIVTPGAGLMPANHYLSVAIDYLLRHRPQWPAAAGVGKTVVSSQMIDRVAARLGRTLVEVPVGFKWFVDGLRSATLGFAGEESAGAAFLRRDGTAWTTDKDGITAALLAAEITARGGQDPGERYRELTLELGKPFATRVEAPATATQRRRLAALEPGDVPSTKLAGETIRQVLSRTPGNDAPIGGLKVVTDHGWFAARPSGTEDIYKIYAESFQDEPHLQQIVDEALSQPVEPLGDEL
ncbi:MAG: phosphoglucomutase (alpha-D-glucose-1,6-bisphosphate-dependent), partial [Burkholderiaceae bacterium]